MRNDLSDLVAVRRELHAHPELGLDEHWTSDFLAARLEALGYTVTRGIATTGLVATLTNGAGRSLGLRADMDALPIPEATGLPYASETPGLMHACGHDGHMAMLLGAAERIAARKNFAGTVHLIFQPAEENFGGAKMMVAEGLFDRFPCDAMFGLHNEPSLPFGKVYFREGPVMAAVDEATIVVHGRGGHGAHPEATADPVVAAAAIVMALQTIVARNISALDPAVVTVGAIHGGTVSNVIPATVELIVGIRAFDAATRDLLESRIRAVAAAQAESFGCRAAVTYLRGYDVTQNHPAETALVAEVARSVVGADNAVPLPRPFMGSEDFAHMLQVRPGSYFFLGTARGADDPPLHHPAFDFNDDVLPIGVAMWTGLAEAFLASR